MSPATGEDSAGCTFAMPIYDRVLYCLVYNRTLICAYTGAEFVSRLGFSAKVFLERATCRQDRREYEWDESSQDYYIIYINAVEHKTVNVIITISLSLTSIV